MHKILFCVLTTSRVAWGMQRLDKPESFWNKVLWTDETQIDLFGHNHKCFACRKNLLPTKTFGRESFMLWGCVASTGTGNLVKVEGRMDSTQYQQILGNNVQDSFRKAEVTPGLVVSAGQRSKALFRIYQGIHAGTQTQCSRMAIPVPRLEHHWKCMDWSEAGCPRSAAFRPDSTGDIL